MSEFLWVVIGLVLLACAFVVFPIMMKRGSSQQNRRQINAALFKSRLSELSQEREQGNLAEDEFERLKTELQRRVLEDVSENKQEESIAVDISARSWKVLLLMALFIPLVGWLVYEETGAKADWEIAQVLKQVRQVNAEGKDNSEITRQLTKMLSKRLEQKPDDPHYLMLLANAEMSLQNYPIASGAYQRLVAIVPNDPGVLAQYAQALYLSSGRQMTDEVSSVVDQTLAVAPNQPTVLGMLGIHHFEQGNYQQAIDNWQRLLSAIGPTNPSAGMIRQGIEQAKSLLGESGDSAQEVGAQAEGKSTASADPAAPAASLQVDVSLDQAMSPPANAQVFVFARAVSGPRMPLAVARLTVADLPASITLDDSMAMTPSLKLSGFDQVEVVARISSKGIANRGSGDMEGVIGPVTISTLSGPLAVSINKLLP